MAPSYRDQELPFIADTQSGYKAYVTHFDDARDCFIGTVRVPQNLLVEGIVIDFDEVATMWDPKGISINNRHSLVQPLSITYILWVERANGNIEFYTALVSENDLKTMASSLLEKGRVRKAWVQTVPYDAGCEEIPSPRLGGE